MPRPRQTKVNIPKRIQKWKSENPGLKITDRIEKTTSSLLELVEVLLSPEMVTQVYKNAVIHSKAVLEKQEITKFLNQPSFEQIVKLKVDICDEAAGVFLHQYLNKVEQVALDSASPLKLAEALERLVTISFVHIGKIGMCFGYDVTVESEFAKIIQIFEAGIILNLSEKKKTIDALGLSDVTTNVVSIGTVANTEALLVAAAQNASRLISKRKAFASIPSLKEWIGGTSELWVFKDVGNAAINVYAGRFLADHAAKKAENPVATFNDVELPKAA